MRPIESLLSSRLKSPWSVMCSSACPTPGAHKSWGECIRGKNLHIGDLKGHDVNKRGEADLQAYADARRQGIQPSGIERSAVDRAVRISESDGKAFVANEGF